MSGVPVVTCLQSIYIIYICLKNIGYISIQTNMSIKKAQKKSRHIIQEKTNVLIQPRSSTNEGGQSHVNVLEVLSNS